MASGTEPVWVPSIVIEAIHLDQIREHGGLPGLRDSDLLESALARPQQRWNFKPSSDAAELAAAYGFGIVKNHPFQDGNKRVGFLVMVVFLGLNGFSFQASQKSVVSTVYGLAAGEITEEDLASWIRTCVTPCS